MSLSPGTRLGPYEIVSALGAGGMGEVYRARDTRLGRDVAVKVLPEHLSTQPEVRARFEREARAVSALNHPHICTLHDVGREGDTDFLVMELVEGETLAARLERGALPTSELLRIGAQIADALDRAHRAGIVHRDLKPANVMLTKSGAKLMDFGLARATGMTSPGGAEAALSQSPTASRPLTAEGTIVGTFQYMAPEQLEGHDADARSDIWALGCVLYEMATARRAFEGKSQASLIGAIMTAEPAPIAAVTPMAPPLLDRLVRRCLAKDPDDRWQSARDVVHELRWIDESGSSAMSAASAASAAGLGAATVTMRRSRAILAWAILATIAFVIALGVHALRTGDRTSTTDSSVEFVLDPPSGYEFALPADPALSPDGRAIACVVQDSAGTSILAIRQLGRAEMRVLPGTARASLPFWSPDGRFIGFFSDGKLRKLALDGSEPLAIADATDGRGGSWSEDGTIIFVPTASGPVSKVPATGGAAVQVTQLDAERGEIGHRFPCLIENDRHFLFVALGSSGKSWLCLGSVEGGPSRVLRETETAARGAVPGWILTVERRRVIAQRFDARSLELSGSGIEVAQCGGVPKIGHPNLGSARNGTLAYQRELKHRSWLRWYDGEGSPIGERTHALDTAMEIVLAPDGRMAVVSLARDNDLWLVDLDHPVPSRLTFHNLSQYNGINSMRWSPDSKRIAYGEGTASKQKIHVISAETSIDTVLFTAPGMFAIPQSWDEDGRRLIALCSDQLGSFDIWTVPLDDPQAASRYLQTPDYELGAELSPDGHWLACLTDVGGDLQVRIYSYPVPGARFQVVLDTKLSFELIWSGDGRTLILADEKRRVIAVPVRFDGGFRQGESHVVFTMPPNASLIAASPDLSRFLVNEREMPPNPAPVCVITSWPERLEKR